jgi:HEAT repeat protein
MESTGDRKGDQGTIGEGFVDTILPVPEEELEGATLFFSQLEKATRIHHLYPEDNRICVEFVDRIYKDLTSFLAEHRTISVSVQETSFTYKGRTVHREPDVRVSIPMRFFRDGVRRLVFYEGFEQAELVALLEVLNTVATADEFEHDAVTLLWEKDFAHLSYFVIEDPFEEEEEQDFSLSLNPVEADPPADSPVFKPPKISAKALAQVLTVTSHDLSSARTLIARELARNLRHDLTTMLFELLTLRRGDELSFHQTVELLGRICRIYVKSERMGEATEVLRKFREVLDLELSPDQRVLIHEEFEANRGIEVMHQVRQLFERPTVRDPRDVADFLRLLGPEIVPELLRMIAHATNPKIPVQVLFELNPQSGELLLKDLESADPDVVRRTVEVISSLQDPRFLPQLLRRLDHPVMAVRLAVVRGVAQTPGSAGREGLMCALKKPEFQVRVQALKGLEVRSDPMVLPMLRELVSADELARRGTPEQQEFLFAIARLGGVESVPILQYLLNQAGRFSGPRTRRLAESAAAALGRLDCPEAYAALEAYRGPRRIREACQVALSSQSLRAPGEEEE